jgi:hypothetical protein
VEVKITFDEFLEKAEALERLPAWERPGKEHYYFRLNGAVGGPNAYLFDELPIFRPSNASTFFMVRPEQGRGLNCRLGSRGSVRSASLSCVRARATGRSRATMISNFNCHHIGPQRSPNSISIR